MGTAVEGRFLSGSWWRTRENELLLSWAVLSGWVIPLKGRSPTVRSGKTRFDLAECWLLETWTGYIFVTVGTEPDWRRIRGEKVEMSEARHFPKALHRKWRRQGWDRRKLPALERVRDGVLAMGSICTCLKLGCDAPASWPMLPWKVSDSFLLTWVSGDVCKAFPGWSSWCTAFLGGFCVGWLIKLWVFNLWVLRSSVQTSVCTSYSY